jgi:cytochrome c
MQEGRKMHMPWHWRLIALAANLTVAAALAASASAAGDPQKGVSVFNKCRACHRVGPGAHTVVGPELNGVVGRKAGSLADYPYSSAVKASGLTWDEATLTQWLRSPRALLPGTRMTFAGISKDDDIANVIAYLKTFDPQGNTLAAAKQ